MYKFKASQLHNLNSYTELQSVHKAFFNPSIDKLLKNSKNTGTRNFQLNKDEF